MHAQAKPERPKGEGHGWPEFYSPQMRPQGHGDSEFSLSRIPTAQTPWPRPYSSTWAIITVAGISWVISARLDYASRGHAFHAGWVSPAHAGWVSPAQCSGVRTGVGARHGEPVGDHSDGGNFVGYHNTAGLRVGRGQPVRVTNRYVDHAGVRGRKVGVPKVGVPKVGVPFRKNLLILRMILV